MALCSQEPRLQRLGDLGLLLTTLDAHGHSPTAPEIDVLIAEGYERQIVLNDKLVVLVGLTPVPMYGS